LDDTMLRHFNTTHAGLDGSVATEDLVRLLGELDVDTPADAAQVGLVADALRLSLVPTPTDPISTNPVSTNPVGAAG
jgi:hypothetical protein